MRKLLTTAIFLLALSACHKGSHRVIVMKNENSSVRIEYQGQVLFKADSTGIAGISPDGYVKFRKNGMSLTAENQSGRIYYEINGDYKRQRLNADEQKIVTSVVHDLVRYGHNIK